jgi:hypothetical protein
MKTNMLPRIRAVQGLGASVVVVVAGTWKWGSPRVEVGVARTTEARRVTGASAHDPWDRLAQESVSKELLWT